VARSQTTRPFLNSWERFSQWEGPLFVAGAWRSGTSLLYSLLNKHPQIGLMYEGDLFVLKPVFWIPRARKWLARWEFWNGALTRHGLDAGRIPLTVSCLTHAMESACREYARQKGALIWGEKSPQLIRYPITSLVRDFPHARFIFIWRDPAAICGSLIRAGNEDKSFFGRRGMVRRTLMGYQRLKMECDRLVSRGAPVHQIHYEVLVKDPAGVMADVCRFLGIRFVPGVAYLGGADRSAIHEGKHHHLVKSECIISSLERPEVLPPHLKRKIERYVSLWREQSGGNWPILFPLQNNVSGKASFRERLIDRVLYCCLRTFDSVVAFVYCFAPFWILKRYRVFKRRHECTPLNLRDRSTFRVTKRVIRVFRG
jgi:hypothetical protein